MDDKKNVSTRIENIILRIAVIGLGLTFIYFGFFIENFMEIYPIINVLYYIFLIIFGGLIIYKIIKIII
jgi:hypothetical protein